MPASRGTPGRCRAPSSSATACFRFIAEYFREPDSFLGLRAFDLSQGQWLSLPMIAAGVWMWWWASRAGTIGAMRQIFLDTETTGLNAEGGDRIVEIGCVEMVGRRLTGDNRHFYLNPQRPSHPDALRVHGLTEEFLADKPLFEAVADDLLAYLAGAEIIIHNAPFDIGFLDKELARCGRAGVATQVRAGHRQPADGARDVPRQEQFARRAVQAAGGGQLQPHAARRAARRRACWPRSTSA